MIDTLYIVQPTLRVLETDSDSYLDVPLALSAY